MFRNNLRNNWKKLHKGKQMYIKGMIRWKIPSRSKKKFQISTYIYSMVEK